MGIICLYASTVLGQSIGWRIGGEIAALSVQFHELKICSFRISCEYGLGKVKLSLCLTN
jgi:hypothetical protein